MIDQDRDRRAPNWWRISAVILLPTLVAVACGVVLWASAAPVVDFVYVALAEFGLLILGGGWVVLTWIGFVRYRAWRASVLAPALVVVTIVLSSLSIPFWIGFQVSKPALHDAAADCAAGEPRHIGIFDVQMVRAAEEGGCLFFTQGGLIDSVGIAYLPSGAPNLGEPRHDGDIGYRHIEGDWYRFVQRF